MWSSTASTDRVQSSASIQKRDNFPTASVASHRRINGRTDRIDSFAQGVGVEMSVLLCCGGLLVAQPAGKERQSHSATPRSRDQLVARACTRASGSLYLAAPPTALSFVRFRQPSHAERDGSDFLVWRARLHRRGDRRADRVRELT
jgi:hypothetical protein